MTDSESPFDDPEVKAAMQRAGVVHRPGLADEMLDELAPLLAEEGIDLNDPNADIDIDRLNAAMNYATERHNMELFTAVGEQRSLALATLRDISDAVEQGNTARAGRILDTIEPDATSRRPSAAQLIGTSMELLDSWHSQGPTQAPLARLSVPQGLGRGRSAAPDLLALARKGRAYASMNSLMRNHGGLALAHGSALLVAASVVALAEHEQTDFTQLADRYLPGAARSSHKPAAPGSAFGPAAAAAVSSQNFVAEFSAWLETNQSTTTGNTEAKITVLEAIIEQATTEGIDPHLPDEFVALWDMVDEFYPRHQAERACEVLHDYVHFRMDTDQDREGWEEAHDVFTASAEGDDDASAAVLDAVQAAEELDDEQRRPLVTELRIISATRELLNWIGTSQPITQAGAPRRRDIATVAAMIGVSAEGVATRPAHTDWDSLAEELGRPVSERQRVYVQSAKELPELMAWWTGLDEAGVIELTSTRIRPGPHADSLTSAAALSLDIADELISVYVAEIVTHPLFTTGGPIIRPVVTQTIARIMEAIVPDSDIVQAPRDGLPQLFQLRAQHELRRLETAGLVEFVNDGPVVPLAVRSPVMLGVMMASAVLESEDT